uniref:Uncharacterized protein n=1 Tax=Rhizophora mucronata TaxID=61149 RepID=A0A2P2PII7_RHIMU
MRLVSGFGAIGPSKSMSEPCVCPAKIAT